MSRVLLGAVVRVDLGVVRSPGSAWGERYGVRGDWDLRLEVGERHGVGGGGLHRASKCLGVCDCRGK